MSRIRSSQRSPCRPLSSSHEGACQRECVHPAVSKSSRLPTSVGRARILEWISRAAQTQSACGGSVSKFSAMWIGSPPIGCLSDAPEGARLLIRRTLRPSCPYTEISAAARQHQDDSHSESSCKPDNPQRNCPCAPALLQIPSMADQCA
jgi:hypothetical protein